jgi:putative ABC transport system substrate-binding protein
MGGPFALQFKPLTANIPIIAVSADPVVYGLVSNFARPGRNITGVSSDAGLEVYGKRLQLLSETVRNHLTNVRFLVANTPEGAGAAVREAAQRAGIPIAVVFLNGNIDQAAYERVFNEMERDQVDGLLMSDAGEHISNRRLIIGLAARHRLPAIYPYRDFVEVGGLMAYSVDLGDVMRRVADMTDDVLRGTRAGDIPVYQQTKFELVLNRTTAKSLGLEFPASLLAVADEVIE